MTKETASCPYLNAQEDQQQWDRDSDEDWELDAHPRHRDNQKNPSLCVAVCIAVETQVQLVYVTAESAESHSVPLNVTSETDFLTFPATRCQMLAHGLDMALLHSSTRVLYLSLEFIPVQDSSGRRGVEKAHWGFQNRIKHSVVE